jgi:hypothetical protein
VVQEPVVTFHWGANSDNQRFLTNSKSYDKVTSLGIDQDDFTKSLNMLGMAGLEQNTAGNFVVVNYMTGYQTKGNASSKEWGNMLCDLEDAMLAKDKDGNTETANATMKQLVCKHMHQIAKSHDVSKEEASFCLSGGQLKYNSMILQTCSLNQVGFKDFEFKTESADLDALDATYGRRDTSWTYLALPKQYEEYNQKVDGLVPPLNFYMWCTRHGTCGSSSIVPDVSGYYKRPNWPLDKEYAGWMLALYKPFTGDEDGLKGDNESFAEVLLEFLSGPFFPLSIEAEIQWKRQRYRYVPEVGEEF